MQGEPAAATVAEPLRIGQVSIVVWDIFNPEEVAASSGLLRLLRSSMNALHIETHQYVLRRELLFQPGDPYDPSLLAEMARNLRGLGYLNNIFVVPVDTLRDGRVDVEVRVQDTWSLKAEFAYTLSSDGDRRWIVNLADDNFLGHGFKVGFNLGENEDFRFHQFFFEKRRLFGSRWVLKGSTGKQGEGFADNLQLRRPFYAQNDPWGLDADLWRRLVDRRYYLSNAGQAGADPASPQSLYSLLPEVNEGFAVAWLGRVSQSQARRVWRLGAGMEVRELDFRIDESSYELSDGREVDLGYLNDPGSPVSREEGTTVYPFLAVSTEGRQWTTTRFRMQYGPVEDVSLMPALNLRAGISGPGTGSTSGNTTRILADVQARDWSRLGSGFLLLQGVGTVSLGQVQDQWSAWDFLAGWVGRHGSEHSPWLTRIFAEAAWGENLLGTNAFVLGLNRGLRTLGFDGMAGDRLVRWNLEHGLVVPRELLGFFRYGFAAFYDGGMAWWQDENRTVDDIRHEMGFGIRFGSTRSARGEIARLDLAWALDEGGGPVFTAVTRGLF